jgi:cobalamin biosynthesis Mg chelatase CobN
MRAARLGLLLGLLAVVGYLLGGCGTGNGLPGFSGEVPSGALSVPTVPEVTLPDLTIPEVTVPEVTVPTLPTRPEATEPAETTTRPAPPTTTQAQTTTEVSTTTVAETLTLASPPVTEASTITETNASQTDATGEGSSEPGTPWGWILLALGLLAAAVTVAIVAWRRRRA